MKYVMIGACVAGLISLAGCATSAPPPATTPDGLELVRSDKHSAVYMKPDAQLDSYGKFGVLPCQVAFRKNWQRDYNSAHRSSSQQVKQRDIDRIKSELGEECTTFFTSALTEAPAYDLVTEWQQGEAVLLVFPNIVNLDITSPDLQSPNMSRTYSASAGSMTCIWSSSMPRLPTCSCALMTARLIRTPWLITPTRSPTARRLIAC